MRPPFEGHPGSLFRAGQAPLRSAGLQWSGRPPGPGICTARGRGRSPHVSARLCTSPRVSARLCISSHVSTCLHTSLHFSTCLCTSPHVSAHLHMSPHVSARLHTSPHVSTCRGAVLPAGGASRAPPVSLSAHVPSQEHMHPVGLPCAASGGRFEVAPPPPELFTRLPEEWALGLPHSAVGPGGRPEWRGPQPPTERVRGRPSAAAADLRRSGVRTSALFVKGADRSSLSFPGPVLRVPWA